MRIFGSKLAGATLMTLLLVLACAAGARAQALRAGLTGKVIKATATGCDPTATHQVACTGIMLKSTTLDLKLFENKNTLLEGPFAISLKGCVTINVEKAESAKVATSAFALFGYRPGATVTVTTTAPTGAFVVMLFGFQPGFLPLGQYGTYMMDPLTSIYWSITPSVIVALNLLKIPNDPNLSGLDVLFQTAYVQVTPSIAGGFLNPTCFRIK